MIAPVLVAALAATIPAIGVLLAWRRPATFAPARGRHTRAYVTAHTTPPPPTHAQWLRDRVVAVQAAVAVAHRRTA